MENQKSVPAWQEFLNNCDEAETKNRRLWDLRPDMDTEEMFAKSEVLDFFKNRDLDPQIKIVLSDAVDELPLLQGTVLRAIYWKGMTTSEVAKNLNTTAKAIYMAKSRGIQELRRVFSLKKLAVRFGTSENSAITEG